MNKLRHKRYLLFFYWRNTSGSFPILENCFSHCQSASRPQYTRNTGVMGIFLFHTELFIPMQTQWWWLNQADLKSMFWAHSRHFPQGLVSSASFHCCCCESDVEYQFNLKMETSKLYIHIGREVFFLSSLHVCWWYFRLYSCFTTFYYRAPVYRSKLPFLVMYCTSWTLALQRAFVNSRIHDFCLTVTKWRFYLLCM